MSAQSLPRARIVRLRAVFDAARLRGRRVSNRFLTLSVMPRDPASPETGTVAFLTPKRLGPAVVRNRVRRRMREIYRRDLARSGETQVFIWIARPPAVDLSLPELREAMTALMEKARGGK